MGKRVHIARLAMGVSTDASGKVTHLRSHEQYAELSCGHKRGVRVSFFSSSGEPIWCDECIGECLACGAPATDCRTPSWEWGESCEACFCLSEGDWCDAVRARRNERLARIAYGPCLVCAIDMTGLDALALIDHVGPERGGRVVHLRCWPHMRDDVERLMQQLGPNQKLSHA